MPHSLKFVLICHDGRHRPERAGGAIRNVITLFAYTSLVCSTAGSHEGPFSSPAIRSFQVVQFCLVTSVQSRRCEWALECRMLDVE